LRASVAPGMAESVDMEAGVVAAEREVAEDRKALFKAQVAQFNSFCRHQYRRQRRDVGSTLCVIITPVIMIFMLLLVGLVLQNEVDAAEANIDPASTSITWDYVKTLLGDAAVLPVGFPYTVDGESTTAASDLMDEV
jgi:hypothetical protein